MQKVAAETFRLGFFLLGKDKHGRNNALWGGDELSN